MTPRVDDILAGISAEALAADCLEFVRVESPTGAEDPGSLFLADLLERQGFPVALREAAPGRHNVLARWPGVGEGRSLAFNGHTDTIPSASASRPSGTPSGCGVAARRI